MPIVHFSVTWWRTLHQQGTVFNASSAHIHGVMAFTLWWGVFAFTLLFVYLLDKRYRLECLEEELEERELEAAIEERVRGASDTPASRWRCRSEVRRIRHRGVGAHGSGARCVLAATPATDAPCAERTLPPEA